MGVVRVNAFQSALLRPAHTLFAPIVYRLAARLDQLDVAEMIGDPAISAYALRNAQKLFELPMVVNHFQLGIELESSDSFVSRDQYGVPTEVTGSPTLGRASADLLDGLIDTAARLSAEFMDRAGVVGVLTGPNTLSSLGKVSPAAISELYVAMAGKYAEARVSAIMLAEAPEIPIDDLLVASATRELVNICRFYRLKSILLAPFGAETGPSPVDLQFGRRRLFPLDLLESQAPADVSGWAGHLGVLTTAGEVPETLPPESLKSWMNAFAHSSKGGGR
ncbi:MAG: hypothetical protein EPN30_04285 [Actinomycetota bacterium]|nr:MAG: hypothetical protein EPN30_04285 [Actinomycetota bacterium]